MTRQEKIDAAWEEYWEEYERVVREVNVWEEYEWVVRPLREEYYRVVREATDDPEEAE